MKIEEVTQLDDDIMSDHKSSSSKKKRDIKLEDKTESFEDTKPYQKK
jgi:hypothetical protein